MRLRYLKLCAVIFIAVLSSCGGGGSQSSGGSQQKNPPQTAAGLDFSVQGGINAQLQGSAVDTDGSIKTIQWKQLSGTPVALQSQNSLTPSFQTPLYTPSVSPITFQLTATDNDGLISSDTVTVSIIPEWRLMSVTNGYGYFAQMYMSADRDYWELELNPGETHDIILRNFFGNIGLRIYASKTISPSQLIAQSDISGSKRNAIRLAPTGLSKVFLEITGGSGNQYSLNVNERSVFLEPGFPVDTTVTAGTLQTGAAYRALTVGNIDSDPELEILVSSAANGPLYAFNHDGSAVNGWPFLLAYGAAYPSIGELNGDNSQSEIATGYGPFMASCENDRFLIFGEGTIMPGWPKTSCNAGTTTPPMLADINNDGVDEIFFGGAGFYSDGQAVPAWPGSDGSLGQPSFGDVTGDGEPELVFDGYAVAAYFLDGTLVPGFPVTVDLSPLNTIRGSPIGLADLDGAGGKEIIRLLKVQDNPSYFIVQAFNGSGSLVWQRPTVDGSAWDTVPSFGDLNGDGLPELLIQTDEKVYAWDGSGTLLPNFPIDYAAEMNPGGNYVGFSGSSAPLIADVTGDNLPDIVIAGANYLGVYSAGGVLEHKIRILDNHVMFAIADIDLDGRNEIVIAEDVWNGHNYEDVATVWVFDLGGVNHGAIQWGQLGGSSRHQYSFPP